MFNNSKLAHKVSAVALSSLIFGALILGSVGAASAALVDSDDPGQDVGSGAGCFSSCIGNVLDNYSICRGATDYTTLMACYQLAQQCAAMRGCE